MNTLIFNGWRLVQSLALVALPVFAVMAQPAPDYEWLDRPARLAPEEGIALWHQYPEEERLRLYFPAVQIKKMVENLDGFKFEYQESPEEIIQRLNKCWKFLFKLVGAPHVEINLYDFINLIHGLVSSGYEGTVENIFSKHFYEYNPEVFFDLSGIIFGINQRVLDILTHSEDFNLYELYSPELVLENRLMNFITLSVSIGDRYFVPPCNDFNCLNATFTRLRDLSSVESTIRDNDDSLVSQNNSDIENFTSKIKLQILNKPPLITLVGIREHSIKTKLLIILLENFLFSLSRSSCNSEVINNIAQFNKAFVLLHPFPDGNGRTVRMFMNYLLIMYGLPIPTLEFNAPIFLTDKEYCYQLIESINLSYRLILRDPHLSHPIHGLYKIPEVKGN